MAGSGFIPCDRNGTTYGAVMREYVGKPSTTFEGGDGLVFINGRLEKASSATATLDAIFKSIKSRRQNIRKPNATTTSELTTTAGEKLIYTPVRGTAASGLFFCKTYLIGSSSGDSPPVNGSACDANTDLYTVLVLYTGTTANADFTYGTILANGEQRSIVSSTYSGGTHTITVTEPFTRAITTGDTAIIVPFSRGVRGVRLNPNNIHRGIDTRVAGKSGGKVDIEDVYLTNKAGEQPFAIVSFQY
jgi:hypothetical protein